VAVAVLELGLVVPDGQQLDALPPTRRGELGELLDGGAVPGLVQAHEQPGIQHAAGLGRGELLRLVNDDGHEELEQGPEPFLLGCGGVEVEGVVAPVSSSSRSRSHPSAEAAMTGSPKTSSNVSAVP